MKMIQNYSDFFSSMLTTSSVSVLLRLKMPSKAESVPNIRTTPFRVTGRTYKICTGFIQGSLAIVIKP